MPDNKETESGEGGQNPASSQFGEHLTVSDVRSGALKNFLVTAFARGGEQLIQLVTLLIMARLLLPSDFGLIAMVAAVFGIADLFRDLGLTQATVQLPQLNNSKINTLFWINTGIGLLMTCLALLLSPWIADFFNDPRTGGVAIALAFKLVIGSLGAQHLALMRRNLRFPVIARITITSALIANSAALVMAFMGAGYWALVTSNLLSTILTTVLAWHKSDWRPGRPAYDPEVLPMISFGGYLVGFGLLSYLGHNLQHILIGKFWGAAPAGLYSRATALMNLPLGYFTGPLRTIAPATLSRLNDSPQAYQHYYLKVMSLLMLALAPFSIWLAFTAPDLVVLVLGSRWEEAGPLLRWISIAIIPQILCNSTGWIYMSKGNSRRMMQWGVMGWGCVIAGMLYGLQWGALGVARMAACTMYLVLVPCLLYAFHTTELSLRAITRACWKPITASLLSGLSLVYLLPVLQAQHLLIKLPASALVYGLCYLLLLVGVFGMRQDLLDLYWKLHEQILRRRSASSGERTKKPVPNHE